MADELAYRPAVAILSHLLEHRTVDCDARPVVELSDHPGFVPECYARDDARDVDVFSGGAVIAARDAPYIETGI